MTMSEAAYARVSLVDAHARTSAFSPLRPRTVSGAAMTPAPSTEAEPDLFALGFAAGERAAAEAFAAERTALLHLIAAAEALQPEPSEELAAMIAATVERLMSELIGSMPIEQDWLSERIDRAMACIGEADAARTLWLHPDDIALLADLELPLDVQPDDTLERGALRIDCSLGWIEDSRSRHLDALRATLGIEVQS
jgi:flagellar assembly protein FliH